MKCSTGFFAQFGGPWLRHQTSLAQWLPRTGRDATYLQIQRLVNAHARVFVPTDQERTRTLDVQLQLPHLRSQVFMSVSMSMQTPTPCSVACVIGPVADGDMDIASESASISSLDPETMIVKLTCTNIRFQRRIQVAGSSAAARARRCSDLGRRRR